MAYIAKRIRMIVPANKAKPAPAIGQALGSIGINMMKFCKEFNAMTVKYKDDLPMRVRLDSYSDNSYKFTVHPPQSTWFIKKCAGVQLGAALPGPNFDDWVGEIHSKQVFEIAMVKFQDAEHQDLQEAPLISIYKSLLSTCKSMGIRVIYEKEEETLRRLRAEQKARVLEAQQKIIEEKKKKKEEAKKKSTYH